jgi:hypothetical protein
MDRRIAKVTINRQEGMVKLCAASNGKDARPAKRAWATIGNRASQEQGLTSVPPRQLNQIKKLKI